MTEEFSGCEVRKLIALVSEIALEETVVEITVGIVNATESLVVARTVHLLVTGTVTCITVGGIVDYSTVDHTELILRIVGLSAVGE